MTEDLSQAFGPSGASGFNKLSKRTDEAGSTPAESTHESPTPAAEPEHEQPPAEPDEVDWEGIEDAFGVGVYLLPEAVRALTKRRRESGQTNADLALDAIDYAHRRGQLEKLLTQRHTGPRRHKDSLFPARRRQPRAASRQSRKLWSFQATHAEIAVLDGLVDKYGAASRSELVSVAVEARYRAKPAKAES